MFEKEANSVWSGRPSLKAIGTSTVVVAIFTALVWYFSPYMVMKLYSYSASFPLWTPELIIGLKWALRALVSISLLFNLFSLLKLWSVRYEITSTRFLYHHGILVRQHDEIELRRIRDYRIIRPMFSQALGLGIIYLITRDETFPVLKIGPFDDARKIHDIIRAGVEAHQKATGYREFEAY